jgi:hypothetical protein
MLYKYLPYERIDVLENLKIRFTPLSSLNDPFKAAPLIDADLELFYLLSHMEVEWEKICMNPNITENEKRELEKKKTSAIEHAKKKFDSHSFGKDIMTELNQKLGILSMSRAKNSLLMWSHYASEGKGYLLAFDKDHLFFNRQAPDGNIDKPKPVTYSKKRRKVSPTDEHFRQKLLFEKPLEWRYEEEERLCCVHGIENEAIGKDDYGQDIILSNIPSDMIKGVYIGYRADKDIKNKISSSVKKHNINCKVFNSRLCDNEYKLEFVGLKNT